MPANTRLIFAYLSPAELAHQYCDPFAGGFRHKRNQDRYALPVVMIFPVR